MKFTLVDLSEKEFDGMVNSIIEKVCSEIAEKLKNQKLVPSYSTYKTDTKNKYSYVEPTFKSFDEAKLVLDDLKVICDSYGYVKVSELYVHAEDNSISYEDEMHGWYYVSGARIVRDNDGWVIKFPVDPVLLI